MAQMTKYGLQTSRGPSHRGLRGSRTHQPALQCGPGRKGGDGNLEARMLVVAAPATHLKLQAGVIQTRLQGVEGRLLAAEQARMQSSPEWPLTDLPQGRGVRGSPCTHPALEGGTGSVPRGC